ncbi:SANT/Myb_domain [Hexamita inflata]|uniref:SANT/Myb domain n=1 Tax=Hexamita inflata TaxID=28002 RepID=A0AA86R0H9_9EUKA|nr:SANT/Myb domain [Hexamita inflata]
MEIFNKQLQTVYLITQIDEVKKQIVDIKKQKDYKPKQSISEESKIKRCRWTSQEDAKLLQLVKVYGITCYQQLSEVMLNKKAEQIYFKIRYLRQLYDNSKNDFRVYHQYKDWFMFFQLSNL